MVNPFECPRCKEPLDTHTHEGGEDIQPTPGDILVCAYCSCVLTVTEDEAVEMVDGEEVQRMMEESPRLREIVANIRRKV